LATTLIALFWLLSDAPVVFAASSTTDVVSALAQAYRQETGTRPRLSFASSTTLARQIAHGAPADIFISADPVEVERLVHEGLVAQRGLLCENRLVMIAGPGSDLERFDADEFDGRAAIGDPDHVPAGRYAREALIDAGWWAALGETAITARDVRSVLRLVELGEVEIGIVYRTDALASSKVNVIHTFPIDAHTPIRYPIALISDSRAAGRDLFAYMRSERAADLLARYGFVARDEVIGESGASRPAARIENALLVSLRIALWCLVLISIPGIAMAWLLARARFPGKVLVEALVHAPLVLPPVITGYLLLVLLGKKGAIGRFLDQVLGISPAFDLTGAVIAAGVMSFPLLVRAARLGFEMVDPDLETAAATLGTSPLGTFFRVTLPLALPGILTGASLAFARSLGEFGATIVFAGNIEGETRSIPLAVFTLMQQPGEERTVFLLACLSIAISMLALMASDWGARRLHHRLRGVS